MPLPALFSDARLALMEVWQKLAGKCLRRDGDRAATDVNQHDEPPIGYCLPYRQAAAFTDAFAPVILTLLSASAQNCLPIRWNTHNVESCLELIQTDT